MVQTAPDAACRADVSRLSVHSSRHGKEELHRDLNARGVVRVLEGGWNRLTPIADVEMEGIQRVVKAGVPVSPHAYFNRGDRVRVFDGPLTGLEGILRP